MREFIDIVLKEVTLAKYGPGKKFLIGGSSVAGKELAARLAPFGINTTDPIELTNKAAAGETLTTRSKNIVSLGKGDAQFEFRDGNNNYFYLTGTSGAVEKALVHSKDKETELSNKGEIAEGILGAAMFAKFTARRPGEEIGLVNGEDIWRVLESLKQTGQDQYQVQVKDANSSIADTITFSLKLKTGPYQDLMNPLKRGLMADQISSAAGYVNNPRAEQYSKYFYFNGRADYISILADGAASETEKKADVWVAIRDKTGNMRALKLNTSLKVGGVAQFGQVGGGGTESLRKLFDHLQLNINPYVSEFEKLSQTDQFEGLTYIYGIMADLLNRKLTGDSTSDELDIIAGLAKSITFFATLGDPNVELVDFDRGGYKILRFRNLAEKLRKVDLRAGIVGGKKRPEVAIYDAKDNKKTLISIRLKVETRKDGSLYVRNIIEKGPLLEELTQVEYKKFDAEPKIGKPGDRVDVVNPRRKRSTRKSDGPRQRR